MQRQAINRTWGGGIETTAQRCLGGGDGAHAAAPGDDAGDRTAGPEVGDHRRQIRGLVVPEGHVGALPVAAPRPRVPPGGRL